MLAAIHRITSSLSPYAVALLGLLIALAGNAHAQYTPPDGLSPNSATLSHSTTNVTLSWNAVPGATFYALRANDYTDTVVRMPGNNCGVDPHYLCRNDITGTSFNLPVTAGHAYGWWIHACDMYGCGSPSSASFSVGSPPAPLVLEPFPPFTSVRTDYINPAEGLFFSPLQISSTPCVNLPAAPWQDWLCNQGQSVSTTYATTYAISNTPDTYFTWIISANNEFIQHPYCTAVNPALQVNSGPPNLSRPINGTDGPFYMTSTASSLRLEVRHDPGIPYACRKIPYMSATYIRGAQAGDSRSRLYSWAELQGKTLVVDVNLQRQSDTVTWFRVITHFRDPATGQRYFINKDYVMPDTLPDFLLNWNWPYINSFQYPGAKILIPARSPSFSLPNGLHQISIPVASQWAQYFPGIQADFLGVEIAVEIGEIGDGISMDIRGVRFQ